MAESSVSISFVLGFAFGDLSLSWLFRLDLRFSEPFRELNIESQLKSCCRVISIDSPSVDALRYRRGLPLNHKLDVFVFNFVLNFCEIFAVLSLLNVLNQQFGESTFLCQEISESKLVELPAESF